MAVKICYGFRNPSGTTLSPPYVVTRLEVTLTPDGYVTQAAERFLVSLDGMGGPTWSAEIEEGITFDDWHSVEAISYAIEKRHAEE